MRAHLFGEREALGVHIGRDHLVRAGRACDPHRKTADRTAAHNKNGAAGDFRRQHRVKRIPNRIHDRADLGGNARERQHVGSGHHDVLGERAVAIDADDSRVPANVAITGAALQAVPAHDVSLGGDQLADAQSRDPVAQTLDLAGELVTDDERRLETPLCPMIPIRDVQVGPADTRVPHGDQDFTGAGRGFRHRFHGQTGRAFFLDDRLHENREVGNGEWDGVVGKLIHARSMRTAHTFSSAIFA